MTDRVVELKPAKCGDRWKIQARLESGAVRWSAEVFYSADAATWYLQWMYADLAAELAD